MNHHHQPAWCLFSIQSTITPQLCWRVLALLLAALVPQGFHLPLTLARQWQCHYLLDAAAAAGSADGGSNGSIDAAATGAAVAALNQACQLLGATACPETPFR